MEIRCKDIMGLPSLKDLRIVGGRNGLNRVLRWVHVLDLPDVVEWVRGGELLFMTGINLHQDISGLQEIVRKIASKNLAGIVINVGPYIQRVPEEVISLADELRFPIFELPWETKLVEVTHDICGYIVTKQLEQQTVHDLLENILYADIDELSGVIARGTSYGYDLSLPHQVAIIRFVNIDEYLAKQKFIDAQTIINMKNSLERLILEVLAKNKKRSLAMFRIDSIILLVPSNEQISSDNVAVFCEIKKKILEKYSGLAISIGIGKQYANLEEFKKSLEQAEQARKFAEHGDGIMVCDYEQLGVNKLLFKVQDRTALESFCAETVNALVQYDSTHETDLTNTLQVLIENNCNVFQASQKLYVHRNTLKYRIQKIEEITGRTLDSGEDRINLYMGLLTRKILCCQIGQKDR